MSGLPRKTVSTVDVFERRHRRRETARAVCISYIPFHSVYVTSFSSSLWSLIVDACMRLKQKQRNSDHRRSCLYWAPLFLPLSRSSVSLICSFSPSLSPSLSHSLTLSLTHSLSLSLSLSLSYFSSSVCVRVLVRVCIVYMCMCSHVRVCMHTCACACVYVC